MQEHSQLSISYEKKLILNSQYNKAPRSFDSFNGWKPEQFIDVVC